MTGSVRLLHLRRLRRQPLRTALAVIAIGAGVTLTVGVVIAKASLDRSFASFNRTLAGPAAFRIVGPGDHGGLDGTTLARVERVSGVRLAVPVVLGVTQATDSHGANTLIAFVGLDCRAKAIVGSIACHPGALGPASDADPPIISRRLATRLRGGAINTDLGPRPLRGAVAVSELDEFNQGMVALYPIPVAQQLFARPGGLDAIYIVTEPGANLHQLRAALRATAGSQNRVLSARDTGGHVVTASAVLPFLFLLSLFGLTIGGQLVYNTLILSLEERRRELAVVAALGGTPTLVTVGVLAEAAVLGFAGGLIGVAGGVLAARPVVANLSTYAQQTAGVHLGLHVSAVSVVLGLLLGLVASIAAAAVPARRAARLDIAGELAERSRRTDAAPSASARRALIWTAVMGAGLAVAWLGHRDGALQPWQPTATVVGLLVAGTAVFRLPGVVAPALFGLLARLPWLQRGPRRIAVANLVNEPHRTAAVTTAVAAAVGLACVLGSLLPGIAYGATSLARATSTGRVFVSTLQPNNQGNVDTKLSPDLQDRLARLPGVATVERVYYGSLELPPIGQIAVATGDGRPTRYHVFAGRTQHEAFKRGHVMIGPALARALHLDPGDSFSVPGRHGGVRLTVGGIWAAPDQLGKSITLPAELFKRIESPRPPNWVLLVPTPGVTTSQLAEQVRSTPFGQRLYILDPDELAAEYAHEFRTFLTPFWILARGLLLVAFIATLSTLLLAGIQRRREHGLLAAVGMPPRDLGRMVLTEAGLIGLAGTLLGGLGSLASLLAFVYAAPTLTGLGVSYRVDPTPLLVYGTLATICVLAGATIPAWRTSRLEPVTALRYE